MSEQRNATSATTDDNAPRPTAAMRRRVTGLAIAGGVFIVPSFAATQTWAPAEKRARIVAAVNVLSAAFMVAGAIVVALLQAAGLTLAQLFLILGAFTLAASVWILRVLPTNPVSDALSIVLRAFYRLEVTGQENISAFSIAS